MQYATSIDAPRGLFRTFLDTQGKIFLQLFIETILDMSAGDELTVLSEERTVVDTESHGHRRFVNSNRFECLGVLGIANSVADLKTVNTDHRAYIAVLDDIGLHMPHTGEGMQLFDLGLDHRAIFLGERDGLTVFELTAVYTTDSDTTYVGVVIERSDQHLRCTRVLLRRRDILDDSVHEVGEVGGRFAPIGGHPTLLGRTVEGLKIELIIGRVEVTHQVEDFFLHLG